MICPGHIGIDVNGGRLRVLNSKPNIKSNVLPSVPGFLEELAQSLRRRGNTLKLAKPLIVTVRVRVLPSVIGGALLLGKHLVIHALR